MKTIFPILTRLACSLLSVFSTLASVAAQTDIPVSVRAVTPATVGNPAESTAATPSTPDGAPEQPPSQLILQQAIQRLDRIPSIAARVRHRVQLFDQQLTGTGAYEQFDDDFGRKTRLELRISVGDRPTSLLEVCDGRFLWSHRDVIAIDDQGDELPDIRRVDLRLARRALAVYGPAYMSPLQPQITVGGLPLLIGQLNDAFVFGKLAETKLHGVPVWVISGTWRPRALERIWAAIDQQQDDTERLSAKDAAERGPDQLPAPFPHSALIAFGKDDLFPYRIEYL
ncbi:MAG: hypothetical protein KDA99_02240 [Planctomycetales bacterium]|nr:hypothetical protein [Planctomycetales bacterium]